MAQWFGYWSSFLGLILDFIANNLGSILAALPGTFFGAYFAFLFERRKRKGEEAEKNIAALNRALYTLYTMWNTLRAYQREHLDGVRNRPDRWLKLTSHPSVGQYHSGYQLETGPLHFLLQTKATTFDNLMLQERRFKLAIGLIDERTKLMLTRVFPIMEREPMGAAIPPAQLQNILGIGVISQLTQYTDQIFKFVDEDLPDLEAAFKELRALAKQLYPKGTFIDYRELPSNVPTAS
jgi:hypothetical protein